MPHATVTTTDNLTGPILGAVAAGGMGLQILTDFSSLLANVFTIVVMGFSIFFSIRKIVRERKQLEGGECEN